MTDEQSFLSALPIIEDVVGRVCRRHHLSPIEAEEFASDVNFHFIDRNYEVLRQFKRRCSLPSYVTVVVERCFLDYRNRLWGKWRPTAYAKRLGAAAVRLEQLVIRDGWSIEQALEFLQTHHGVTIDDALTRLCVKILQRPPHRRRVPEDEADELATPDPSVDDKVFRDEQDFRGQQVLAMLDRARQNLPPADRLIVRLWLDEGASVAGIARTLRRNQKRLYRTLNRILEKLRASLEADGLSAEEVRTLFESGALSDIDRGDDDDPGGGAGAMSAPVIKPRTPWLQTQ